MILFVEDDIVKYDGEQTNSSRHPCGMFNWLYNYFSMDDDSPDYYADECTTNEPTLAETTEENFSNTGSQIIIKNLNLTIIMRPRIQLTEKELENRF